MVDSAWYSALRVREIDRKQERIQENILKAIGEQPPNETKHIGCVWLSAKQVRFEQRDAPQFRQQLFGLIEQVDNSWSQKPDSGQEGRALVYGEA